MIFIFIALKGMGNVEGKSSVLISRLPNISQGLGNLFWVLNAGDFYLSFSLIIFFILFLIGG